MSVNQHLTTKHWFISNKIGTVATPTRHLGPTTIPCYFHNIYSLQWQRSLRCYLSSREKYKIEFSCVLNWSSAHNRLISYPHTSLRQYLLSTHPLALGIFLSLDTYKVGETICFLPNKTLKLMHAEIWKKYHSNTNDITEPHNLRTMADTQNMLFIGRSVLTNTHVVNPNTTLRAPSGSLCYLKCKCISQTCYK